MQRHQTKHMIAAAIDPKYKIIVILGEVNKTKLRILLDSGATGNHMNPDTAEKLQLKQQKTDKWVTIISADGRPIM
jgi:predicted aspartyl protease